MQGYSDDPQVQQQLVDKTSAKLVQLFGVADNQLEGKEWLTGTRSVVVCDDGFGGWPGVGAVEAGVTRVFNLVQDVEYEGDGREACATALAGSRISAGWRSIVPAWSRCWAASTRSAGTAST